PRRGPSPARRRPPPPPRPLAAGTGEVDSRRPWVRPEGPIEGPWDLYRTHRHAPTEGAFMPPTPDRTRVKICGIRDDASARAAAEAGADAIGFDFARSSPRHFERAEAALIMAGLPPLVVTVGLFVNPRLDDFCAVEEQCPPHYTQFHGAEPEPLVRQCGPDIIKAVRFNADTI